MTRTVDAQLSKRFRRPRTLEYWGRTDGLFIGQHKGQIHNHMWWHFFNDGDVVEFKDPNTGELCQRKVKVEVSTYKESDYGNEVVCFDNDHNRFIDCRIQHAS